jgi:hypothetical protein
MDKTIETGKPFFKESTNNMYDEMPAVWKNSTPKLQHHKVVSLIDQFYHSMAPGDEAGVVESKRTPAYKIRTVSTILPRKLQANTLLPQGMGA